MWERDACSHERSSKPRATQGFVVLDRIVGTKLMVDARLNGGFDGRPAACSTTGWVLAHHVET
jgi:hypothetical protein